MVSVSSLFCCAAEFGSRESWPLEPHSWFSGPFCVWRFFVATKLFVGNLSFSTTNADLEALFGQVGAVTSATVIMDKITGRSRGFGFVEMANAQDIATAIERFNGADMQGRALTVNEAKPQEPRAGGGRSFGGGGDEGRGGYRSGGGGGRDRRW
jgi:cold-inducible RNA-binding protein